MQVVDLEETLYQPDKQLVMVATEIGGDTRPVGTLNWILHTQTPGHCFTVHTQTPGEYFTLSHQVTALQSPGHCFIL